MISPLTHRPTRRPGTAYRVPFRVERGRAPAYSLRNTGTETLYGVMLGVLGKGVIAPARPERLAPGQAYDFTLRADDPSARTIVIVRWFRPDQSEYLWRVSF